MKISVFGLGYVGAVSCACLAKDGHQVTGVDVNVKKVELINNKTAPILERDLDGLIRDAVESGRLKATTDTVSAINDSEVSIICVGTPSMINGNINLSYILNVCEEIGAALKNKDAFHTVVIRSTVSPGTLKNCTEVISDISGKRDNIDFGLANNPEFLREGAAINDYFNPPYIIIGSHCERSVEQLKEIYKTIDTKVYILKPEESEMIKYANNNFHALKITFANEIGNICKSFGIDSHVVMDIVARDTKLNLSPYYLKPGFAFGGSCLPKDVRGLMYNARMRDLKTPMLNSLLESNDYQVQQGMNMILATGKKKIGVLGFAFKPGTDDLRESPLISLIEQMIGKGFELSLYDSNVILSNLTGKNKEYIAAHLPHISKLLKHSIKDVLAGSEVIIIGTKDAEFKDIFSMVSPSQIIIDLVRIEKNRISKDNYVGICW